MVRVIDTKTFIQKAATIHNNKYDYTKSLYKKSKEKIIIICQFHGDFLQSPNAHLRGNGCPSCSKAKKLCTSVFIDRAKNIGNNKTKYDYSKVNYLSSNNKVYIKCKVHNYWFYQTANDHLMGHGCSICGGTFPLKKIKKDDLLKRINSVHYFKYKYINLDIKNKNSKINIICPIHGTFKQNIFDHLNGKGCQQCGNNTLSCTKDFIKKAKIIHNNKYDYNLTNYIDAHSKIKIICKQHGKFFQKPNSHLNGNGCPRCTQIVSKLETKWLNSLNIKEEHRQISLPGLPKRWKVDGYDPNTNTVYEFHGDYWHANPNNIKFSNCNTLHKKHNKDGGKMTYEEVYKATIKRDEFIINAGYNLITIWESDFIKNGD